LFAFQQDESMDDLQFRPQPTPNPNCYKFVANRRIEEGTAKAFYDAEAAKENPLAERLFALPGVTGVLLLDDFCSINQDGSKNWDELTPQVEGILQAHYAG
jgi:hypothetical protein